MFTRRKLMLYILLNIFISACVTLSILFVYENNYRSTPLSQPVVEDTGVSFEIAAVVGAGLPASEMVLIRNTGEVVADLKDWQLRDADSNIYTFGAISLPANAAVQLRTAPGKDSVIDLYWGLSSAVWVSGETASLLDPAGIVRSVYKVP